MVQYKIPDLVQNEPLSASIGKWNNLFTAVMILTNTGDSDLAITNMEGYYCSTGRWGLSGCVATQCMIDLTEDGLGEWVKCDDGWIGVESSRLTIVNREAKKKQAVRDE